MMVEEMEMKMRVKEVEVVIGVMAMRKMRKMMIVTLKVLLLAARVKVVCGGASSHL